MYCRCNLPVRYRRNLTFSPVAGIESIVQDVDDASILVILDSWLDMMAVTSTTVDENDISVILNASVLNVPASLGLP